MKSSLNDFIHERFGNNLIHHIVKENKYLDVDHGCANCVSNEIRMRTLGEVQLSTEFIYRDV